MVEGCFTWSTPLPLANMVSGTQHVDLASEAPQCGTVETIERGDDGWLRAEGWIDDETDAGAELVRQLQAGTASHGSRQGVSIDADDLAVEIVDTTIEAVEEDDAVVITAAGGARIRFADWPTARASFATLVAAADDGDPEDGVVVFEHATGDVVERWTRARLRGLTSVATPAFADAWLELTGDTDDEPADDDEAVTAAANAPVAPPADWFEDPALDGPHPMTITDDGRVFGHLAAWGTCHVGFDRCVTPPRGGDYSTFMSAGGLQTAEGDTIRTGALVWGIPHASLTLSLIDAAAHYADETHGFADVRVGEDEHGIWFAGALRPGVDELAVRRLRGLSISGDWRSRGGSLDLIAGLAVNIPGFPIPHADAAMVAAAGGAVEVFALVAAGIIHPEPATECSCGGGATQLDRIESNLGRLLDRTAREGVVVAAARLPSRE